MKPFQITLWLTLALAPVAVLSLSHATRQLGRPKPVVPGAASAVAPQPTPELTRDVLCGPKSIIGAAARLGVAIDLQQFLARCPVGERGCSMAQLKRAAESFGLSAAGVRLDWAQLRAQPGPVLVFLAGDHYAFIDPRERPAQAAAGATEQLRLYDAPKSARWIGRQELERSWQGESLVLGRAVQTPGLIQFDSLLMDFGLVYTHGATVCEFPFRNVGTQPLKILSIQKACGCAKAEATPRELAPGQSGKITVTFDLKGRQGDQRQNIFIKTNDPQNALVALTCQGKAINPVHVSCDMLDFGDLAAGGSQGLDFVLTDRGAGQMQLTGYQVALDPGAPAQTTPTVQVKWQESALSFDEMTSRGAPANVKTLVRGRGERHFQVRVSLTRPASSPLGLHQGRLTLKTSDPAYPLVEVPFVYHGVETLAASSSKLLFGVSGQAKVLSQQVELRRNDGRAFGPGECSVTASAESAQIQPVLTTQPGPGGIVLLKVELKADGQLPAGLHRGLVRVQTKDRLELTLPWVYLQTS